MEQEGMTNDKFDFFSNFSNFCNFCNLTNEQVDAEWMRWKRMEEDERGWKRITWVSVLASSSLDLNELRSLRTDRVGTAIWTAFSPSTATASNLLFIVIHWNSSLWSWSVGQVFGFFFDLTNGKRLKIGRNFGFFRQNNWNVVKIGRNFRFVGQKT